MDTDAVKQDSSTLKSMKTIREVLGSECRKPFISLIWEGRDESALEVARRLASSMRLISGHFPAETNKWYPPTDDNGGGEIPVEEDPGALENLIEPTFNHVFEDNFFRSSTYLFLFEDPAQRLNPAASINVVAGFRTQNRVTIELPESFPLGPPSAAARLFLDLMRIWQPDSAEFSTISAVRASMGKGYASHAAYLAWASAKAQPPAPAAEGELVIPFGDGWLYVAKKWTVPAIVALHQELNPGRTDAPKIQDTPNFPDGYPVQLDGLDSAILWGSEPNG
ncbi:hypothetical protein LJ754_01470 [Arthrobacter sp. zg-Y40]|uniref:hypothetical protein n=1 Tax=Arthrobacter sp. zg-Y40 TaxID=2886939 RepID=UPI001D13B2AC|nr:hypothetical protein [Arthrobacter sp. zg-Y40]MCC3277832.1 hypothetical protein [Arthrobacter sp. zg-Y40]